jgi:hypothetical protein
MARAARQPLGAEEVARRAGCLPADAVAAIEQACGRGDLVVVPGPSSRVVAVVAHHDCAGNPGPKDLHLAQLQEAAGVVKSWRLPVRIVTLWVNEHWQVEPVDDNA